MKTIAVSLILILTAMVSVGVGEPVCKALVRHPELDGELDITAEQREALEDLYQTTEKDIIESTGKMRVKRLEMDRLMRSPDPDIREVRKLVNEIGDARSAAVLAGIERNLKMRKILTPEQMQEARRAMTRMARKRGQHYGDRGFHRGDRMRGGGMPGKEGPPCHGGMMHRQDRPEMEGMGRHRGMMRGPHDPAEVHKDSKSY
jgi:Spy/CpxP family protein refolding chaperone